MRYLSQIFQPLITIPKNAKIKNTDISCKSQKLLLECGLIRPSSPGLFTILPLARRALDKLESLIKECIEEVGGQRLSMPALTSSSLWDKSGRLYSAPSELMKVRDRTGNQYLLAPTYEEAVADLLADVGPLSYKQLPLLVYQISNKYRDELRPKHGLLRAREFSMMDAYGCDVSEEAAQRTYRDVTQAYTRLFEKLQLPIYRVEAPPGDMGGSLSHEWHARAAAGEDALHVCAHCASAALGPPCARADCTAEVVHSIEVGHTFILGTKYSESLGALAVPAAGGARAVVMSCYGIGITRLLAASLEVLSTETSLRWPEPIAPFANLVIGPKEGSKEWSSLGVGHSSAVAESLGRDTLVDDRHHLTIGKRLMMAERLGYPTIVVCGKSALEPIPKYEVFRPARGPDPELLTLEELTDGVHGTVEREQVVNKV